MVTVKKVAQNPAVLANKYRTVSNNYSSYTVNLT